VRLCLLEIQKAPETPSDLSYRAVSSAICSQSSRRLCLGSLVGFAVAWNWTSSSSRSGTKWRSFIANSQVVLGILLRRSAPVGVALPGVAALPLRTTRCLSRSTTLCV